MAARPERKIKKERLFFKGTTSLYKLWFVFCLAGVFRQWRVPSFSIFACLKGIFFT